MKKGFNFYIRTCLLVAFTAGILLSLTGCCTPQTSVSKDAGSRKSRESFVNTEKTGVPTTIIAHSLQQEKPNTTKLAGGLNTGARYKDLSMHIYLPEAKRYPLGVKSTRTFLTAGPNISFKSAGDDVYANGSHKPGIGFQAGFGTEYRFNEKWSVVPSLLYKRNTASEEADLYDGPGEPGGGDPGIHIEDKYSYNYLSLPILAQYNLTDDLTLIAGPEVNYLLKSKVKSNSSYGGENQTSEEDLTDNSVKLGLGVQVGLQYQIPDSRWGIQVVYDHRLSRLNKKNPEGYGNYEVPAWRMKSVQVGVTCKICDLLKGKK